MGAGMLKGTATRATLDPNSLKTITNRLPNLVAGCWVPPLGKAYLAKINDRCSAPQV